MNIPRLLPDADHRFVVIPLWLEPLLGRRELAIITDPTARVLCVDQDDQRLPNYQRVIEAKDGRSFTIDSRRRAIIG